MKKFQTYYNNRVRKGEKFELPSATIPGQALTVDQLRNRFTKGLGATGARAPIYLGEDETLIDSEEFHRMDLSDQEAMIEANAALVQELQQTVKKHQDLVNNRKREMAIEEALEKRERERLKDAGYNTQEVRQMMAEYRKQKNIDAGQAK